MRALFAALLFATTTAMAQGPREEARDRFDRGLALFDRGEHRAALAEFTRAYELVPNAVVLYNIGLVHAKLGRPVQAVDALDKVIAEPGALPQSDLAGARRTRDEQIA